MGVAVSTIAFPVSSVVLDGPHRQWIRYSVVLPSGSSASTHRYLGPIDLDGGGRSPYAIHVSANNTSGADNIRLTVLGSFNPPSTTPTGRSWMYMRADVASGAGQNQGLNAVTCGGYITLLSPARSLLFRLSSVTAVSDAVNISVLGLRIDE